MQMRSVLAAAIACAAALVLPSCGDGSTTNHAPWVLGGSVHAYALNNSANLNILSMSATVSSVAVYDAGSFRQPLTVSSPTVDLLAGAPAAFAAGPVPAGTFPNASAVLEISAQMTTAVVNPNTGFEYRDANGVNTIPVTCTLTQTVDTGLQTIRGGLTVQGTTGGELYLQTAYISGTCLAPPLPPDNNGYQGPDLAAVFGRLNKVPRADVPAISFSTTAPVR